MRGGEETLAALRKFVARWRDYAGTERSEAQSFIGELFDCYGSNRRDMGAIFEDSYTSTGVMDLHLPGVVIIEMKAPKEVGRLVHHRKQALDYWRNSADVATKRPAPRFVVLCAFHEFEVWEPGKYPNAPLREFTLEQLPDHYDALLFLAGEEPLFNQASRELTKAAATAMAEVYRSMLDRRAATRESVQRFVLQMVWLFFAEDYGMVGGRPTERILDLTVQQPYWSTYVLFGGLFAALNDPDLTVREGVLKGTKYVNGELFARPAPVHISREEAEALLGVARYDWRAVDPTIFGALMEGFLGAEARGALGAHYTHEVDILRIVRPTIVRPWRERIEAVSAPHEGVALLDDLCRFRVLDPACGCGNFLYVAYRELRALECALKERVTALAQSTGMPEPAGPLPYFPLRNMHGIDIEPVAAQIARVTLWMGHRQMIERYGPAEMPLPLVDLSTIQATDALRVPWPEVDCIVGNPPFLGSQHLREARGDEYLKWLSERFGVGVKDYCVYWFRRAHDHLQPGQRAGLVGTNSIAQNRARSASLDYVVANDGVITDAISTQVWPGDAKVHVSLVNWVKSPDTPPGELILDGLPVSGITADLRTPETSTAAAVPLPANKGRCFQGPIPVGDGFILTEQEARALLARKDADYSHVVRPYLTGEDIAEDPRQAPRRWIIDFGRRALEEASRYPAALAYVRERVKSARDNNARKARRDRWWLFGEQAAGMRTALAGMDRYIAVGRIGKRLLLTWCDRWTCPSDLAFIFAFSDDYSMGVLSSSTHSVWARSSSSTLEDRLRYTPTSAFMPFPWPDPVTEARRERVAEASRCVIARRQEICVKENFGLTKLYNLVDEGAYADLKKLHRDLDEAVATCYGWPKSVAQDPDEITRRLLQLNHEIASGERAYNPFSEQDAQRVAVQLGLPGD